MEGRLGFVRGLKTFTLPDLPYDYGDLEPAISAEIMMLHHQKHHQTYITNYNKALEQLDQAMAKGDASTVVNCRVPSNSTAEKGGGEPPKKSLGWAIDMQFGSLESLIQKLTLKVRLCKWLALDKELKKITVETTANQDPLVTKGIEFSPSARSRCVGACYKNVKPDYLKNIWKVINWTYASDVYEKESS
ncbi:hypothetical protein F8388_009726 [Cannabis sativa]|uniref:Superoxide dismutase n=1 Tax=Cannabis sativa TaxID=3483 RepID=A0A7J6H311_CANSA|nr:hypothetical protein F8388_009726 [Cannabis sativa]